MRMEHKKEDLTLLLLLLPLRPKFKRYQIRAALAVFREEDDDEKKSREAISIFGASKNI